MIRVMSSNSLVQKKIQIIFLENVYLILYVIILKFSRIFFNDSGVISHLLKLFYYIIFKITLFL